MAMLGAAKDPAAKAFDLKLGSLAGPFQFRPVYATPDNWYDPDAKDNWTTHTVGQQTTTPTQPPPAPPTRPPLQLPPLGWRVLPNQFRPAIQTSVASGHWMSFTAQAQPAPSIPRTAGTALRMRAAMTAAPAAAAPPATLRLGRPVSFRPLVAAEATAKLNAAGSAQPVATDSLDLGFDHCVVALNWPWFPQAFLLTRNWYVPGYARASFANGTGAGDPGLLPVLPSAFVVIRNLRICAKWSNDDIAAMQASASFGPFSLVGRSFDSGSGALTCPGMQIIGWFYNALPVLPPADDPALAPAAKPSDSATPAVTEPTAVADASGPASSPAPPAGNQPAGSVSIAPAPATPDRAPADPANATAAPSAPNPATAPAPAAALPSAAPAAVPGAGGGAAPSAENPGTTAQGA
ncbi:MAG TPA: hypothetical protein VLN57_18170 [Xanthobacteraceae bacterium]|nr:hypothetical protein [Xanthobacteraceae bacterium]